MNQRIDRQKVYEKFNGHCAYCGKEITIKQMQVDHIVPKFHTWKDEEQFAKLIKKERGTDDYSNLNPSCSRCNKWKSTFSIEQFRNEIFMQIDRLKRDSSAFRMASDFGIIRETKIDVFFYFETIKKDTPIVSINDFARKDIYKSILDR